MSKTKGIKKFWAACDRCGHKFGPKTQATCFVISFKIANHIQAKYPDARLDKRSVGCPKCGCDYLGWLVAIRYSIGRKEKVVRATFL